MKTESAGPWLGINNRLPNFALHVNKVGDYLRSADNVDITNKGTLRRRNATLNIAPMSGPHSLHMLTDTTGHVVVLGVLYDYTAPNTLAPFKVLSNDSPVSWLSDGDDLYYSNGTDSGRISGGIVYPLGMATPDLPVVTSIGGGTLLAGMYQVSVSYSNSVTGEESGLSGARQFTRTTTGGLHVALPTTTPGATHINVYASGANGDVLQLAATVAVGTTGYDITALATGRKGVVRFEAPLPEGELFMSNNRMCSIVNDATTGTVYIGEPWRYGYYRTVSGRLHFKSPVTVAVENQGGTYICTEVQTFWYPGDLANLQGAVSDPLPYGAVRGTVFKVPDAPQVGWFGAMGVVLADTQGGVTAPMNENIDQIPPAIGTSAVLQSNGLMRVVSCGWCYNLENKATTNYLNWNFTSISGAYGTLPDGIYLIDTDGVVDASFGLGKNNFGTEQKKPLPAVYLGVASAEPMSMRVQAPNGVDYTYEARSSGEDMQMQRIDPGKGLCATWYDLTISNTNGAAFDLSSASFGVPVSTWRI